MPTAAIIIGDGIGNQIMTTPMIQAVKKLGYEIDLYIPIGIITDMFDGWNIIRNLYKRKNPVGYNYDVAIKTFSTVSIGFPNAKVKIVTPHGGHDGIHEVECAFEAARRLGYKGDVLLYHIEIAHKNYNLPKNTVVIHPGCKRKWLLKVYPYFSKVIDLLIEKEYNVVLVGGEEDIGTEWNPKATNYINKLSLKETASIIKQADYFISGDSGIMHVACTVGTKGLALFGPTSLIKNSPRFGNIEVLQGKAECVPCYEKSTGVIRRWTECKYDRQCLRSISPEEIIKRVP